jgi:hypothetical protein
MNNMMKCTATHQNLSISGDRKDVSRKQITGNKNRKNTNEKYHKGKRGSEHPVFNPT